MVNPEFDSELAEKFELVAEGYWMRGMTLAEARKKAAEALVAKAEAAQDIRVSRQGV